MGGLLIIGAAGRVGLASPAPLHEGTGTRSGTISSKPSKRWMKRP